MQSIPQEQALVGCVLNDPEAFDAVSGALSPLDFSSPHYRKAWESCSNLHASGQAIDVLALYSASGVPLELLREAAMCGYSARAAVELAKSIKNASNKRKLAALAYDVQQACAGEAPYEDVLAMLDGIAEQNQAQAQSASAIGHGLVDFIDLLEKRLAGIDVGTRIGLDDIDNRLCGMHGGDLIIVAARPGAGKTALAMQIAVTVAEKMPVYFVSLEMGQIQLQERCMSYFSGVPINVLRTGKLQDSDFSAITVASNKIKDLALLVDYRSGLTVKNIRATARGLHKKQPLGLVVVDYLQLITGSGDNRTAVITDISRGLKLLARELNVPVIALSQLNRGVESRVDKRPLLSDLRDSGSIEQDADAVMLMYRDDYYNSNSQQAGICEINIAKLRQGETGTAKVRWDGSKMRFSTINNHVQYGKNNAF